MIKKEDKADDKKKAWYKRLWDTIVKMFKTIGSWFTSAWKWIKKKFGKGGDNDVEEVAKKTLKGQVNAISRLEMFLESNSPSTEEIKQEAKTIATEEIQKAGGIVGKIADELAEEMAAAVVTDSGKPKLDVKKIKVTFLSFNQAILKRFTVWNAAGHLSSLQSAANSFPSSFTTEEEFVTAGKRLSAYMLIAGSHMLNVLFGDDTIGQVDNKIINILTGSQKETSNTVDDYGDFEVSLARLNYLVEK